MNWVYDKTSGVFLFGGPYQPSYDVTKEAALFDLPEHPDQVKHRANVQGCAGYTTDETHWVPLFNGLVRYATEAEMTPVPQPDTRKFEGMMKVALGSPAAINTLLTKYPLFLWTLRDENWPYVEQLILGAHAAGDVTAPQYAALQAAVTASHLPITLP